MTRTMENLLLMALIAALCLGTGVNLAAQGQTATPTSPPPAVAASDKPHGPVPAELTKSLDSKKVKEDDPVSAKVTVELHMRNGGTIPRGSTLMGRVTEAKARSKGDPQSTLGFTFNKLTTPDGKVMEIKGMLVAIGPGTHTGEQAQSGSIGPGMMAGHEGTGTGTTPTPMPNMNQGQQSSAAMLNAQSKGVVGLRNLQLEENGVLTSSGKEVKLDSGTQMIIQIEID